MPEGSNAARDANEALLCDRFARFIPEQVNSSSHLVWRGRNFTTTCLIQIGRSVFWLRFQEGRIVECRNELPLMTCWTFAVRGSASAWDALWQSPPPAGWHDIFALSKRGEMIIEGNIYPLMTHLQYFKDVLALPRKRG